MQLPAFVQSIVFVVWLFAAAQIEAANILALFAFPAKSHSIMYNRVMVELLNRGHNLTIVGNHPLSADAPPHEFVHITPSYDVWGTCMRELKLANVFHMHNMTQTMQERVLEVLSLDTTEYALAHPNVQRFTHSTRNASSTFDLVIVEQFFQEAFLMYARQFSAPLVAIASFEFAQHFNGMFGVFDPWSHVPHEMLLHDADMSFWQRVENVQVSLFMKYHRASQYMPQMQALSDKYFGHLPADRPTIDQLNHNISVLLVNGHTPLNHVRPTIAGIVDVGGLHIGAVQPLPEDLQHYMDEATDGIVYFSLGTNLRSADLPEAQFQVFVRTFERFPRLRIVWKWEDETAAVRLPGNVLVRSWLPQNDILAHPNVRFFITHGGLLGTQEGVWHAVPMLGIPVYADQHQNVRRAERAGYAIAMDFDNISDASLQWAFEELLYNPSYALQVRRISEIFRDRPEEPLQRAIYWIEYVIRHRGAEHLRSAALRMDFVTYFLLDIVAAVAAVVLIGLLVVFLVLRASLRMYAGTKPKEQPRKLIKKKN